MKFSVPANASEAIRIQQRLRGRVIRRGTVKPRLVAGADVSCKGELVGAISVVLACAPRYRLPEPQRLADPLTKH